MRDLDWHMMCGRVKGSGREFNSEDFGVSSKFDPNAWVQVDPERFRGSVRNRMFTQTTILAAEDQESAALLLMMAFEATGLPFRLAIVENGQCAVDYLKRTPPYNDRAQHPLSEPKIRQRLRLRTWQSAKRQRFRGNRRRVCREEAHEGIAVFKEFEFAPGGGDFEGVTFRVSQDEEAAGGKQAGKGWIIQELLSEGGGTAVDVFFAVRRVGEDDSEFRVRGSELGEGGEDVLGPELQGFRRQTGGEDVVSECLGVTGGFFDAKGGSSTAAEAFEAEGAGAGEEFKHVSTDDTSAEAVEDSLFDEVGRGTDAEAFRNFQDTASGSSASDTHADQSKAEGWRLLRRKSAAEIRKSWRTATAEIRRPVHGKPSFNEAHALGA
jgi:hypothetical protein